MPTKHLKKAAVTGFATAMIGAFAMAVKKRAWKGTVTEMPDTIKVFDPPRYALVYLYGVLWETQVDGYYEDCGWFGMERCYFAEKIPEEVLAELDYTETLPGWALWFVD